MYILYLDDSGKLKDKAISDIIYAGFAIPHNSYGFIKISLKNLLVSTFNEESLSQEVHATNIYGGRGFWRNFNKNIRIEFLLEVCKLITKINNVMIFATACHKSSSFLENNNVAEVFKDVNERFARCLGTLKVNKYKPKWLDCMQSIIIE